MDEVRFHGKVDLKELDRKRRKAIFKALPGFLLLFVSAIFFPPGYLEIYGPFIFPIGALLIGWGLVPYQMERFRLSTPPLMKVNERNLDLKIRGRTKLSIPLKEIKSISWENQKIVIEKKLGSETIPFFSKKTYEELKNLLDP